MVRGSPETLIIGTRFGINWAMRGPGRPQIELSDEQRERKAQAREAQRVVELMTIRRDELLASLAREDVPWRHLGEVLGVTPEAARHSYQHYRTETS
jgi:hypothetical protein